MLAGDEQGRSPYRAELEASIEAQGLAGRVVVAGHCEDMPAAFKAASFTVLPSIEAEASSADDACSVAPCDSDSDPADNCWLPDETFS